MSTFRVSNNSQLSSALRSAGSGDTIALSSGTYSLNLRGENVGGATIKEASGAKATFTRVDLANVSNLKFEGLDFVSRSDSKVFHVQSSSNITVKNSTFDGTNTGYGFWVNKSDKITLDNNIIKDFRVGVWIGATDDLTVSDNKLSNIRYDGIIAGRMDGAVFSGNSISLNVPDGTSGAKHTDGIQFYNTAPGDPMSNIVVRDNHIETNNTISHGIYAGNGIADSRGGTSNYFHNVTIDHNTVVSAQLAGIAVGATSGLKITHNILLQDPAHRSNADVRTPAIRVDSDSTGVTITGNVVHETPKPSGGNWQPTNKAEPGWTISNNKVVAHGTSVKTAESLAPSAGAPDAVKAAAPASAASASSAAAAAGDSNGHGDTFRFHGDKAANGHADGVDFGEGDTVVLTHFDAGTFRGHGGGNYLAASLEGNYVKIDSLADLRELDSASSKVKIHTDGDTLVLDIAQKGADHVIELAGLGHVYADLV
jgi:parallel beta-helix repeat protein